MFRGAVFYQPFSLRFLPIERSSDQLGVMQLEPRSLIATAVSALALWVCVWLFVLWVNPDPTSAGALLAIEVVTTIFAEVLWARITKEEPTPQIPIVWIGGFVLCVIVSALFLEMDCHGTLHFVDNRPTCDKFGGGISIVFTLSAIATTVVALPLAFRAWLLKILGASNDNDHAA